MTSTGRHASPWDSSTEQLDQVPAQTDRTGRHLAAAEQPKEKEQGSVLTQPPAPQQTKRRWWKF